MSLTLSTLSAIVCAGCFCLAVVLLKTSNFKKRSLTTLKTNEKRKLSETLCLMPDSEILSLFYEVFSSLNAKPKIIENRIEANGKIFIPLFCFEELSANSLINETRNFKEKTNLVILSSTYSKKAVEIAKLQNVLLVGIDEIYNIIQTHKPNILEKSNESKKTRNFSLSNFIDKRNGFKFIFYGISLDFMSLLAIYPTYYVFSGTFFIALGLISIFFGNISCGNSASFETLLTPNLEEQKKESNRS